jgi:hypothetical protein
MVIILHYIYSTKHAIHNFITNKNSNTPHYITFSFFYKKTQENIFCDIISVLSAIPNIGDGRLECAYQDAPFIATITVILNILI